MILFLENVSSTLWFLQKIRKFLIWILKKNEEETAFFGKNAFILSKVFNKIGGRKSSRCLPAVLFGFYSSNFSKKKLIKIEDRIVKCFQSCITVPQLWHHSFSYRAKVSFHINPPIGGTTVFGQYPKKLSLDIKFSAPWKILKNVIMLIFASMVNHGKSWQKLTWEKFELSKWRV